jgi:hypothetical protein
MGWNSLRINLAENDFLLFVHDDNGQGNLLVILDVNFLINLYVHLKTKVKNDQRCASTVSNDLDRTGR